MILIQRLKILMIINEWLEGIMSTKKEGIEYTTRVFSTYVQVEIVKIGNDSPEYEARISGKPETSSRNEVKEMAIKDALEKLHWLVSRKGFK